MKPQTSVKNESISAIGRIRQRNLWFCAFGTEGRYRRKGESLFVSSHRFLIFVGPILCEKNIHTLLTNFKGGAGVFGRKCKSDQIFIACVGLFKTA